MATPTTEPAPAPPDPRRPPRSLRPLLIRLHFYAGILVAPFILVAAVSGGLYAVAPTLERVVHAEELAAPAGGPALPLTQQVAAAREAEPDLPLLAVQPADTDGVGETTRVLFDAGETDRARRLAVFVDPASAEVRGELTSYGGSGSLPVRTWVSELHRHLHLGEPGRLYSELAASWLGVVALAGLALWWTGRRRTGGRQSMLRPLRRAETGSVRRRTLSWHGALGTWVLLGMLMLSVTGLTWSAYAGTNVSDLRVALGWTTPTATTDLAGDDTADGHEGHEGHGGSTAGLDTAVDEPGVGYDAAAAGAAEEGLSGPLEIQRPVGDTGTYVVSELDSTWPTRADVVSLDPADGSVVDVVRFEEWPLMARFASWGIDLHMGVLFGAVSQVALVLLAAAIVVMTVWGYRMWWLRRPTRGTSSRAVGRAPRRGAWRSAPPAGLVVVAVVAVVVGWFVPLLGISLLGFLVVDLVLGWRAGRRATVVADSHPDETLEDVR